jgi:hypothetical protein
MDEVTRRYSNIREALARDGLDAVIACGTEYTGFEGAVTYMSGFTIVHRYAYVLLPLEGEPAIVFPAEARYVGEHGVEPVARERVADVRVAAGHLVHDASNPFTSAQIASFSGVETPSSRPNPAMPPFR